MYKIKFYHRAVLGSIDLIPRLGTICEVYEIIQVGDPQAIGSDDLVSSGVAKLNPKDQYSKAIGRKVSLLKATSYLPTEERSAILKDWFEKHPKDRSAKA